VTTLLTDVRNQQVSPGVALFSYYNTAEPGTTPLGLPLGNYTGVKVVRIHFVIDVDPNQDPGAIDFSTDITVRPTVCDSAKCGVQASYQCVVPAEEDEIYTYPISSDDYVEGTFALCQNYCKTNLSLPENECCSYSVDFFQSTNLSGATTADLICSCVSSEIPSSLATTSVPNSEYTDFVKECFNGTTCGGSAGQPYCQPGCLQGAGTCACDCS
jgi:hypothetical protein